jgi:S1-C subfamily serine protease
LYLGDILVTLGDTTVDYSALVQQGLDSLCVGKSLQVRVIRGGELRTLSITVGERK